MTKPATRNALLFASMLCACSAFASDINKCTAPDGSVTLTDSVCPGDTQATRIVAGVADGASQAAPGIVAERFSVGRLPPRYVTLAKGAKPQRGLALDVATLRAAKLNLLLLDNAAQVSRSQRLATLH